MISLLSKISRNNSKILLRRNLSTKSTKKNIPEISNKQIILSSGFLVGSFYYLNYISDNNKTINNISMKEVKENYSHKITKVNIINNEIAICHLDNLKKIQIVIPDGKYFEEKMELNVPYYYQKAIGLGQILPTLATLGLIGTMIWMMRRQMGGMNNLLGTNNKIKTLDNIKTKFSDIIGQDNAKNNVKEFVDILKNKEKYSNLGVKVPRGALLSGPPGTGKTLLAKAIAGESKLPFVNMSGSDFNAMFVGVGSAKVKNLYKEASVAAKEHGGCIVFIDEIDAIGQKKFSQYIWR